LIYSFLGFSWAGFFLGGAFLLGLGAFSFLAGAASFFLGAALAGLFCPTYFSLASLLTSALLFFSLKARISRS
jgi:hypothetical protein